MPQAKHYRLRPDFTPSPVQQPQEDGAKMTQGTDKTAFTRAACEDDDGYDPYSDRPSNEEVLFEEDPWK